MRRRSSAPGETKMAKKDDKTAAAPTKTEKLPLRQKITEILVRRGLASSLREAEAMVRNDEVLTPQSGGIVIDPDATYRFNEPIRILTESSEPSSARPGRLTRREFARRAASAARVVTFDSSKKTADRPAAKSGYPPQVREDDEYSSSSVTADSKCVGQVDLEELIYRRIELENVEERIAVALSKGARVERGVHTAELVPTRDDGHVHLKLVVR
jgi:hypothetical protein